MIAVSLYAFVVCMFNNPGIPEEMFTKIEPDLPEAHKYCDTCMVKQTSWDVHCDVC